MKTSPVNIKIDEDATPYHGNVARRMPIPLLPKVENELRRMEKAGIIKKITELTPWCAPMVAAPKKPDQVRICIDLKQLNKVVQREWYIIPAISQVLANLTGSVCFSKLDASGGYWQMALDEESSKLTSFITPLGRFCMTRVPFGISSASEIFQRKMEELLEGLKGVECYQDDIIVHGHTVTEHNALLQTVLQRIKESGLKLNKQNGLFNQTELEFLGHKIGREGTSPHPNKIRAIVDPEQPDNVFELRSVLGMVNHLGQYLPHLSTVTKPLNDLLKRDSIWNWGYEQQNAFTKLKAMVTSAPTLAYFDPTKPTTVSADASSYGIGGVLLQESEGKQHPVAFCSRTLIPTEQQYAQIERECLACVWSCDKFTQYLRGLHSFRLITDHKLFVPLIGEKDLNMVPLRCQRLLMRMMWFNPKPEYVPGKQLVVADLLSRKPMKTSIDTVTRQLEEDVSQYVNVAISQWPASSNKLGQLIRATADDRQMQSAIQYTRQGWPRYAQDVPLGLGPLYEARHHLSIAEDLLVYGDRIVVPISMRSEILSRIHDGHPGVVKSRE